MTESVSARGLQSAGTTSNKASESRELGDHTSTATSGNVGAAPSTGSCQRGLQALGIISDEHRSLAAVLHGMLYLVRKIRYNLGQPDFVLLGAMVSYLESFPEGFHHPKEDQYLFRLLRLRNPAGVPMLDALHEEHCVGANKMRTLVQALLRYERDGNAAFGAFAEAVSDYAAFEWDHMRREETEVLPMARQYLTEGDWNEIHAAFSGHTDPLFGAHAALPYAALFTRIVTLAPPPLGVAPHSRKSHR